MAKCHDCRFIDYFVSEDKYWCHMRKDYVDPKGSICDRYKAKISGPLDKYI